MSDLGLIFLSGLAIVALSLLSSHWISARRPVWSVRRIAALSALPLPLLVWLLAGFAFVRAAVASKRDCGVDACGIAMAGAIMLSAIMLALYLVAAAIVYLIVQGYRK